MSGNCVDRRLGDLPGREGFLISFFYHLLLNWALEGLEVSVQNNKNQLIPWYLLFHKRWISWISLHYSFCTSFFSFLYSFTKFALKLTRLKISNTLSLPTDRESLGKKCPAELRRIKYCMKFREIFSRLKDLYQFGMTVQHCTKQYEFCGLYHNEHPVAGFIAVCRILFLILNLWWPVWMNSVCRQGMIKWGINQK